MTSKRKKCPQEVFYRRYNYFFYYFLVLYCLCYIYPSHLCSMAWRTFPKLAFTPSPILSPFTPGNPRNEHTLLNPLKFVLLIVILIYLFLFSGKLSKYRGQRSTQHTLPFHSLLHPHTHSYKSQFGGY